MEELINDVGSMVNLVIGLILIITFFVLAYRVNLIKNAIEGKFSGDYDKLINLHNREVFKGNNDKAKELFLDALYSQITNSVAYMYEDKFENPKNNSINNIVKQNHENIDRYSISTEKIIEFYFKRSDTII